MECWRASRVGRAPTWGRGWEREQDRTDEISKHIRIWEPILSMKEKGFINMEREKTRIYSVVLNWNWRCKVNSWFSLYIIDRQRYKYRCKCVYACVYVWRCMCIWTCQHISCSSVHREGLGAATPLKQRSLQTLWSSKYHSPPKTMRAPRKSGWFQG